MTSERCLNFGRCFVDLRIVQIDILKISFFYDCQFAEIRFLIKSYLPTASESGPSVGVDLSFVTSSGPSVATEVSGRLSADLTGSSSTGSSLGLKFNDEKYVSEKVRHFGSPSIFFIPYDNDK